MKFKKYDFIDFESKNQLTQKTWLVILMFVCIYFVYNIIIGFFSGIYGAVVVITNPELDIESALASDSFILFSLYLTAIAILLSVLYVRFLESRPLKTIGVTKGFLKQYCIGYLIGIAMISLPTLAYCAFGGEVHLNTNVNYGMLFLFFLGFVIQGASEEFLMRGYLLTSLAKTTNIFWATLISSVGFAMLHLSNPAMGILPFINLALFGVFASFFFLRTKNIWAICAIHSAWNFFQGNVYGIQVSGMVFEDSFINIKAACPDILSGGDFGLEGGLFVTAVFILATVITIFSGDNNLIAKYNSNTAEEN